MGKISREKMTGLTHEERIKRARNRNPLSRIVRGYHKYKRFFKKRNGTANNSRRGINEGVRTWK